MNMREKWTMHCVHKSEVAIFIMSHSWVSHTAFGIEGDSNNMLPDLPEMFSRSCALSLSLPTSVTHTQLVFLLWQTFRTKGTHGRTCLGRWRGYSLIKGEEAWRPTPEAAVPMFQQAGRRERQLLELSSHFPLYSTSSPWNGTTL